MLRFASPAALAALSLALPALTQDEGWSVDLQRKPSGETQIGATLPNIPQGGVVNLAVHRIVDKPNLATRMVEIFRLDPPSERFVMVGRDGQVKRTLFVLPPPGTYDVTIRFDKSLSHTAAVANLFEKGKIEPWTGTRRFMLGETKDHLALADASGLPIRKLVSKIEAILNKLDKPVVNEDDAFGDAREAEAIVKEAERLLPQTGLPGTVELVRILGDMILNYIRFTPKKLARAPESDDGHERQMQSSKSQPGGAPPGQDPPKVDPSGDGVAPRFSNQPPEGGASGSSSEPAPAKQLAEPSAFVKRLRALLEDLRWFHLRETALILMRRLEQVVDRGSSPLAEGARTDLMKDLQLIESMDGGFFDDKGTTGEKYRAFTTASATVSLRKLIQAAGTAMVPKEAGGPGDVPGLQDVLRKLQELQPFVRRFGQSAGGKD